jgi:DNA-binding LytR/AlgR family response regulator
MLRLAIVDDNPNDSAALRALVADYLIKNNHAHVIQVFNAPMDFIRSTENHDIVFMDIRMDKLDGLEVARIMRKINTDSVLVFVTAMAQLAIKGYEVDALDFIVKPADQGSIN